MRAISVAGGEGKQRLIIGEHDAPESSPDEVIVRVKAVSINNGEVRGAFAGPPGHRPGWDLAGVVETPPPGAGFAVGDRVVGLKFEGAWAERVTVSTSLLAQLPPEVSFEAGSVLPVAGLTAAIALTKRPLTKGDKVLITAATGGVGSIAIQLAAAQGARVTAFARHRDDVEPLLRLGAQEVAVGQEQAAKSGPYDLILEGIGGSLLGEVLAWLSPRGVCVQFGDAGGDELTTFDAKNFRLGSGSGFGGTSLYGFFLIEELIRPEPADARAILADLASRLAAGTLDPAISMTRPWREVDEVARALLSRRIKGKAVLRID